jgi:ubiquinone/menaquinone biosynthesis C-methylase UbiE
VTHRLSSSDWLDLHYEVCRPEYERLAIAAGFEQSWHVLDAGCGSGAYGNVLRRLVGEGGVLVGCDVSADNIRRARTRGAGAGYDEVTQAAINDLPYRDGSFDGVWCANVLQLLDDDEAVRALRELCRVTKPGGRIAIKDVDMLLWRVHPLDPLLITRLMAASVRSDEARTETLGALRGRTLRRLVETQHVADVAQQTMLIERWAPLSDAARRMYAQWLQVLAGMAEERDVSQSDMAVWRDLAQPDSPTHPLNSDCFYACEGQVLVTATVP